MNGIGIAQRNGFDYIEMMADETLCLGSDKGKFSENKEILSKFDVLPEVFNCFLPPDLKVVGPAVEVKMVCDYVRKLFDRAKEVGGEIITFGSDAHRAASVGSCFDVALEMARAAGFTRLATFEKRRIGWMDLSDCP